MLNCNPSNTPVIQGPRLPISIGEPLTHTNIYRSTVGGLQYLTMTRPDICDAVTYVAQFMHTPTSENIILVNRILRYLKRTLGFDIVFAARDITSSSFYSHSDLAGFPHTKRSTSGISCVFGIFNYFLVLKESTNHFKVFFKS